MSKQPHDNPVTQHQTPPPTPLQRQSSNINGPIIRRFLRDWLGNIKIPPFQTWRKPIKQALAMMIAAIMTLSDRCREAIGQGSLLCCIVIVFFFPARTFGVVVEDVVYGTFGALIASLYALLGIYCADLARDPTNPVPVQPTSSGVLIVFLFIGVYIMACVRFSIARANFACIHVSIIFAFTLTDASLIAGFNPTLVWQFLIPVTIGAGIALAVSAMIWPDDSMTNYMGVLYKGLEGHNVFFKEYSEAFFSVSPASIATTLPSLHDRLQECTLTLIDCKRAVHRDILYSRLNGSDVSKLTKLVKQLRAPLYGIGLSQIVKREIFQDEEAQLEQKALKGAIEELSAVFRPVTEVCYNATAEAIERLHAFDGSPPRSALNSILWPFPRLMIPRPCTGRTVAAATAGNEKGRTSAASLKATVYQLAAEADSSMWPLAVQHSLHHHERSLHLFGQYRYQLREYARSIVKLLEFVEHIEQTRTTRRLWFPTIKALKKRFHRKPNEAEHHQPEYSLDLSLVRTNTRREALGDLENPTEQATYVLAPSGKLYHRDPDVDPPATRSERFWYGVYKAFRWLVAPNRVLALKTASGAVLIGLPFYISQETAAWYFDWRGNWAMIIVLIWLTPNSGSFIYTNIMRLLGTAVGGVLGIVIWEIAQGNPYGLAVVLFLAYAILYYVLLSRPAIRVCCVLTVVTTTLVVIYTYNYKVGVFPGTAEVWTVAGKRMLLVCIGLVASALLSVLPAPVMGRVQLRKSLAHTIRDVSRLYGILTSQQIIPELSTRNPTKEQEKGFRRLTLDLRRQIAEERTYMQASSYEPPLRGRFPAERYKAVLERVDAMADLVSGMGHILVNVKPSWRRQIAMTLREERRDYIASIMTTMKLVATTLSAKMALPPYLIAPIEARRRFIQTLTDNLPINADDIINPSFLSYSAYIVTSSAFVKELQCLLETVEDLVGVEDPQEWLRKHM